MIDKIDAGDRKGRPYVSQFTIQAAAAEPVLREVAVPLRHRLCKPAD